MPKSPILEKTNNTGYKRALWQIFGPSFFGTFNRKVQSSSILDELNLLKDKYKAEEDLFNTTEDVDQLLYVHHCISNNLTPRMQLKKAQRLHKRMRLHIISLFLFTGLSIGNLCWWGYSGHSQWVTLIIMLNCIMQNCKMSIKYGHQAKQIYLGSIFKRNIMITSLNNFSPLNGPLYRRDQIIAEPTPFIGDFYNKVIELEANSLIRGEENERK
jgi:hypothetical protein